MALTHWKDFDDYLDDPYRYRRSLSPYWRRPFRDDYGYGLYLRDFAPTTSKDGYQACIDVHHFRPFEISVKTCDNTITIEGKHTERRDDHGYISRQFTRRYTLPFGYDSNTVTYEISSDGVLTLKAQAKAPRWK